MCGLELQTLKGQEHQSCLSSLSDFLYIWLQIATPDELPGAPAACGGGLEELIVWTAAVPLCCADLLMSLHLTPAHLMKQAFSSFLGSTFLGSSDLLRGLSPPCSSGTISQLYFGHTGGGS